MKKLLYILFSIAMVAILAVSCTEDDLEPTLAQDKNVEGSIATAEDIEGILYGMYNRMTDNNYYGRDYIIFGEIRADNCFANGNSGRFTNIAKMGMTVNDAYANDTWTQIYRVIASANIIIAQEEADIEGDADEINHFIGQAYAVRALAHFDLLKLYGQQHVTGGNNVGIPYVTTYKGENLTPARNTRDEVKGFIEADLAKASGLMTAALDDPSAVYITTSAVNAIKARVAIYFGDWSTAVTACEAVISSGNYSIVPQADFINSWVIDGAVNSIFELAFSSTDNQNINGLAYIYRGVSYGDIECLQDLADIFEAGDIRGDTNMIGIDWEGREILANMGKYPSMDYSDNVSILRYEEVILNYAEALLETGDAAGALTQLNLITAARGASAYAVANKDNILLERRKEFCFEGFRSDDLLRNGMDIPLPDPIKQTHGGPAYGSFNLAFPIPENEMNANSNMTQNQGYTG